MTERPDTSDGRGHVSVVSPSAAAFVGLLVAAFGEVALAAWLMGHMAERGLSSITVKTNAALCFALLGIATALAANERPGDLRRWLLRAFAGAALVVGALTLVENVAGLDLGIDQRLAAEPAGALGVISPNRMGTPASTSFVLLGASLLLLSSGRRRAAAAAQRLALVVLAIGLLTTIGYVYGVRELYDIARLTAIAWPTAIGLMVLAAGILVLRPHAGPMAYVTGVDPPGVGLRRLLGAMVVLPVVVGWLLVRGERIGLYGSSLGSALMVMFFIVCFSVLAYRASRRVSRAHAVLLEARATAERARAASEDANRAKDHFLAVLSHELRTPLSPVLAGVSLLEHEKGLSAEGRRVVGVVRRNVELEALLIDDLLDMTRIARGKVALQRSTVELCGVIEHALEVCRGEVEGKRLRLAMDLGPRPYVIDADPARLQQVFWNLLENAVKFTPPGGEVHVRCRPDGAAVRVEIRDSGIGIEREALGSIFDAFVQAARNARQFGGLGLGLAITKALVELHGGTIEASSEGSGKGATFAVRLPLVAHGAAAALLTAAAPDARRSRSGPGRLRVLLVEDHVDTAETTRTLLELAGHEVEVAGGAGAALRAAAGGGFDVMVSDVGLPDGSGHELVRSLRSRGDLLPAIALSGHGMESDVQRSRAAGFDVHLVKPVDPDRLLEAMATVVNGAGG